MAEPVTKRRRWFSFSLRAMLLALTAFGVALGWWANSAHRQRAIVLELELEMEADDPFSRVDLVYDYADSSDTNTATGHGRHYLRSPAPRRGVLVQRRLAPGHVGVFLPTQYAASQVPPAVLRFFGKDFFHNVTAVELRSSAADDVLEKVSRLPHIQTLIIETDQPVTEVGMRHLARLRRMKRLRIDNAVNLGEESFRILGRLSRLEMLELQDAHPTDEDLDQLSNLKSLKLLRLSETQKPGRQPEIRVHRLALLGPLTNLEELWLPPVNIDKSGVQHLLTLRNLTTLEIPNSEITDEDVKLLLGHETLDFLSLRRCRIDGSGFRDAPASSVLQWLNLSNTEIVDASIPYLARLPNLAGLNLKRTQVTAKALEQLKSCPTLRYLNVDRFVEADLKRLRQALPGCTVQY
ncbi:MAG TPA: hypothetical protein VGJ26_05090 [Pirellulales bacterium]|jgi:hypothetical protein